MLGGAEVPLTKVFDHFNIKVVDLPEVPPENLELILSRARCVNFLMYETTNLANVGEYCELLRRSTTIKEVLFARFLYLPL